jgi:hypothetical protein
MDLDLQVNKLRSDQDIHEGDRTLTEEDSGAK